MICNETSHRLIYRVSIFCICFHLATSVHSIAFHISTSSSAGYFDPFSYDEFSLSSSPEVLWTLSNINKYDESEFSVPNSNREDIKLTNVTVPGCVHTALVEKQFIQEDLLYRYNEDKFKWVPQMGWVYSTDIPIEIVENIENSASQETEKEKGAVATKLSDDDLIKSKNIKKYLQNKGEK